ncbi:Hypothetical predicted protein [Olea europaea subsp. europaea]|uniref:Uncharacterized protein n=1 Tax=Olea europaea subsp. europaea TaxID=158383 RepID=A0A8S0T1R3_OLEEU|nr:Hypothetical predicted protein [Olea europaea subsp. europaea]
MADLRKIKATDEHWIREPNLGVADGLLQIFGMSVPKSNLGLAFSGTWIFFGGLLFYTVLYGYLR